MYQSYWICPYILSSLFLTVDEPFMLSDKVNDSTWSSESSSISPTQWYCFCNFLLSLLYCEAFFLYCAFPTWYNHCYFPLLQSSRKKMIFTHCLYFWFSKLHWTSLNYPHPSSKADHWSKSPVTFKLLNKMTFLTSHWTQYLSRFWNNWSFAPSWNFLCLTTGTIFSFGFLLVHCLIILSVIFWVILIFPNSKHWNGPNLRFQSFSILYLYLSF